MWLETTLGQVQTDLNLTLDGPLSRRRPDAIVVARPGPKVAGPTTIFLLDFTRTSGNTVERLREARRAKEMTYERDAVDNNGDCGLATSLRLLNPTLNIVTLIFQGSYSTAIDEEQWHDNLERHLHLLPEQSEKIMQVASNALCEGFCTMMKTRNIAVGNLRRGQCARTDGRVGTV
jgi:hypothetical protein